jgi:cysteine dioxygenase
MTTLHAHPLRTTIGDFIVGLRDLENAAITGPRVLRYLSEVNLEVDAFAPYLFWKDDIYTRNLIYRDELFEVIALCWKPGHKTPVHTHNGQLGWATVLQGELLTHNYRYVRCSSPQNQNVVGMDCLGGSHNVVLNRIGSALAGNDGSVVTVDKLQTIHQIENVETSKSGSVSLHIYSKPIDSCVAFDLEKGRCGRRQLSYYSRNGVLLAA